MGKKGEGDGVIEEGGMVLYKYKSVLQEKVTHKKLETTCLFYNKSFSRQNQQTNDSTNLSITMSCIYMMTNNIQRYDLETYGGVANTLMRCFEVRGNGDLICFYGVIGWGTMRFNGIFGCKQ